MPILSLYLELLKKSLIDFENIGSVEYHPFKKVNPSWKTRVLFTFDKLLRKRNFAILKVKEVKEIERMNGYDWPANAKTMIGWHRLTNIEQCIETILIENIEGDLMETGVWRGGATILMRAALKEKKVKNRRVWLADSFEGLPPPNEKIYPADKGNYLHQLKILKVGLDEVKNNFREYDLLDDQVQFLPGWFKDTLPNFKEEKLALLRLDGDMYESTILALEHLYPKLSVGGFVIVDDYNAFPNCKLAVDTYCKENDIEKEIIEIDKEAIFWRK